MPRPQKTDDSRRAILEAARAEVKETGSRNLSLRSVAARAGFSPASLYEYFAGKDDLIASLAGEALEQLTRAMRQAARSSPVPAEALVALGMAYVRYAQKHREDFLLFFFSMESSRKDFQQSVPSDSAYAVLLEVAHRALAGRKTRPTTRDAETIAYALWAAAHGMAMLQLTHLRGFQTDFESADRMALRALVDGFHLED